MSIKTRIDESILAKDYSSYTHGIVPISGTIYLSNQRVFFEPSGLGSVVSKKIVEIEIEQIEVIELHRNGFSIECNNETHRFSGSGAKRMFSRLQILHKSYKGENINLVESDVLNEQVLIQGDVLVFLRFGYSNPGSIILSQNRLKIECVPSVFLKLFTPKNINTHVQNIKSFTYHPKNRSLDIFIEEEEVETKISLMGKICAQIFLYLQSLQDGNFYKGVIHEVILYQGVMGIASLSSSGYMLLSSKHLLFCATSVTDHFIGTSAFAVSLKKIKSVEIITKSMSDAITITTEESDIIFGANDITTLFQSFFSPLCSLNRAPPFRDLRYYPTISQSRARRKLQNLNFDLKKNENAQLLDWVVHKFSGQRIQVGWLLLTSERLCFVDNNKGLLWQSVIKDLQNSGSSRQNNSIIRLSTDKQKKIFIPQGGSHFINQMWSIITGIRPEQEAKEGRPGQSLSRVLGRFHVLNILEDKEDGEKIFSTNNVEITKLPNALRIMLLPQPSSPLILGNSFQVEVPYNEGRFRFSSKVREDYVAEPDPVGRYYATFSIPKDISVYNQRSSYRVSFSSSTIMEVFSFDDRKKEAYHVKKDLYLPQDDEQDELLFEEEDMNHNFANPEIMNHLATKQSQFYDISLGGCALSLTEDLGELLGLPIQKILIYIEIPFKQSTLPILATITNSRRSYENPNHIIYGCQFINVHPTCEAQLKIGVLDLEREQLRSMITFEELNQLD